MPGYALHTAPQRDVSRPLWNALRTAGGPATVSELHIASRAHPNAIQLRLRRWVRAGFVNDLGGRPKLFIMSSTAPNIPVPPRMGEACKPLPPRTTRERLWSSIRVLKTFDLPTLMISAEASRRSAEEFINCLLQADYIARMSRGNSMRGDWSTYQLRARSGPKAPVIKHGTENGVRFRRLYDPNNGSTHDISPGRSRSTSDAKPLLRAQEA